MNVLDLIAFGLQPTQAKAFAPFLAAAFDRFFIRTPEQQAGFLAQAMHESRSFTRLEENLYYTSAGRVMQVWPARFHSLASVQAVLRKPEQLANTVYAGRNGNGDFASGDGWRFRGRGLMGLTFRSNYFAASQAIGRDYLAQPDLVAQPEGATLTAAWYWHTNGCNDLMSRDEFDKTTRRINPALQGFSERRALYADIRSAMEEMV